jgi:hypothetical protein
MVMLANCPMGCLGAAGTGTCRSGKIRPEAVLFKFKDNLSAEF